MAGDFKNKFNERWSFPNGIGALDGKHIVIQQPGKSGSHYHNYKGTDSIVLVIMVLPEYEFLYVEVGANGRNSDGCIWDRCELKKAIFCRPIALDPVKVRTLTLAAITLHNWQRSSSSIGKVELLKGLVDQEASTGEIISGSWRDDVPTGT